MYAANGKRCVVAVQANRFEQSYNPLACGGSGFQFASPQSRIARTSAFEEPYNSRSRPDTLLNGPPAILESMNSRVGVTFCGENKIASYEFAVAAAGLEPVRLTIDGAPSLKDLDGLLLTGGADVNPARYGQERGPQTEAPDDLRDQMECDLLAEALRRGVPVLAICRGLQLINVHLGGTLHQHIEPASLHAVRKPGQPPRQHQPAHPVVVDGGTRLASIVGAGEHQVNSRHHQAVDRVGRNLRISARSTDGIVEGLELESQPFVVAVQWHPEDRIEISPADRKLFEAFSEAVRELAKP